ncbi:hypothetical protein N0V90_005957 [Kalmusia sp. IMI 367209]|nr:hypothetical protein N0V90_005957 [Kalmusia sp. IMI 367209]
MQPCIFRAAGCATPQTLPFARDVQPHTLVNLLQDGLWFDKLQAEAANVEQRYHFGRDHGRPYSVRNGAFLTLDQGIPAHELAEQANGAVQEPPPKKGVKRKKKPNGVVEPRPSEQVNGDAMDIEPNGANHVANHVATSVNSVRAESEAMASEAESPTVADLPISTLSIGQSTDMQTEVIANLVPNTTFIPGLKDPEKVVEHTSWGPPEAPLSPRMLKKDAASAVSAVGLKLPMNKYSITALCWLSSTEITVSAREEIANETGEKMMIDKLVKIIDGGGDYQVISSTAGLVNTLRWNKEKELLLSISTDGERGSIKIWKNHNDSIPAWAEFTDTVIFDALWINDSTFVVCGIELFRVYEIVDDTLRTQRNFDTKITWETLKNEPSSGIIAALGIDEGSSLLGIIHPTDTQNLQTRQYPDQYPTDLDFRKNTDTSLFGNSSTGASSAPPVLLTTCSMSGVVRMWDANAPFESLKTLPTTEDSQAFKVAFSPDGSLLAAAGPDAVTVWDVEKREVPIASWRAQESSREKWNPGVDGEFSLGWDPDGSRLSVALGNQVSALAICVIQG